MDNSYSYSTYRNIRFEDGLQNHYYPNPVSDKLQIKIDDWESVKLIRLLNKNGQLVFESSSDLSIDEIDMGNKPAGMYLLEIIRTDGSVQTSKIAKQ